MARRSKKKKFAIRFELSPVGVIGLGIVGSCIFLWMFLLGIWTGQTVLKSSGDRFTGVADLASSMWAKGKDSFSNKEEVVSLSGNSKWKAHENGTFEWEAEPDFSEPSVFSLQVGLFPDQKRAMQAVLAWRARGYTSFSLPAEDGDGSSFKVFVGKYDDLAAANAKAAALEGKERMRTYITLLPISSIRKAGP